MRLARTAGRAGSVRQTACSRAVAEASQLRLVRLDDDLGRAREHGLGRHLHALPFHIGERILTAGRFDEVVEEPDARADEDVAKRPGFPAEDQRDARPRPPCD